MTACRLIKPADATALATLIRANREFLAQPADIGPALTQGGADPHS
jgi:hypothetical protein